MNAIEKFTPQMKSYTEEFANSGNINWQPYTMYFQPFNFKSDVVNTDSSGFRMSVAKGLRYSVNNLTSLEQRSVKILAGSSTVFGIGASRDNDTLSSVMTEVDPDHAAWVNFGGRSFNSAQEYILFALNRHKFPKVDEIVLFSGFNDLGLARLPSRFRMEHGAFFMCGEFYDAMSQKKTSRFNTWFRGNQDHEKDSVPTIEEQIRYAAERTLRNLSNWKAAADALNAKLTFVLQPLSTWVREKGSYEEELIFAELERRHNFAEQYGGILLAANYVGYAETLSRGAKKMNIRFIDSNTIIRARANDDQWIFADRIHFTSAGHDFVARILLENLKE